MNDHRKVLNELFFYYIRLSKRNRNRFQKFISISRKNVRLSALLNLLEDSVDLFENQSIRKLSWLPRNFSRNYRLIRTLKKKIVDFELSGQGLSVLSTEDEQLASLLSHIKNLTAAQVFLHNGYHELGNDLLKNAMKYKVERENLTLLINPELRHYSFELFHSSTRQSPFKSRQMQADINYRTKVEDLYREFLETILDTNCCSVPCRNVPEKRISRFLNSYLIFQSAMFEAMYRILVAVHLMRDSRYTSALEQLDLAKKSIENGVSLNMTIATINEVNLLITLECNWYLNRPDEIEKQFENWNNVGSGPYFHRLPVKNFFLHYFLLTGRIKDVEHLIASPYGIKGDKVLLEEDGQFDRIIFYYHFYKREYRKCLRLINRYHKARYTCKHQKLISRLIEMICLSNLGGLDESREKLLLLRRQLRSQHQDVWLTDMMWKTFPDQVYLDHSKYLVVPGQQNIYLLFLPVLQKQRWLQAAEKVE